MLPNSVAISTWSFAPVIKNAASLVLLQSPLVLKEFSCCLGCQRGGFFVWCKVSCPRRNERLPHQVSHCKESRSGLRQLSKDVLFPPCSPTSAASTPNESALQQKTPQVPWRCAKQLRAHSRPLESGATATHVGADNFSTSGHGKPSATPASLRRSCCHVKGGDVQVSGLHTGCLSDPPSKHTRQAMCPKSRTLRCGGDGRREVGHTSRAETREGGGGRDATNQELMEELWVDESQPRNARLADSPAVMWHPESCVVECDPSGSTAACGESLLHQSFTTVRQRAPRVRRLSAFGLDCGIGARALAGCYSP